MPASIPNRRAVAARLTHTKFLVPDPSDGSKLIAYSNHPCYNVCRKTLAHYIEQKFRWGDDIEIESDWVAGDSEAWYNFLRYVATHLPIRPRLEDDEFNRLSGLQVHPNVPRRHGRARAGVLPDRHAWLTLRSESLGLVRGNLTWQWTARTIALRQLYLELNEPCLCTKHNVWTECGCVLALELRYGEPEPHKHS